MLYLVGHVDARLDRMDARTDTRIEKWAREVNSSVGQKVGTLVGKQEETRLAVGALDAKMGALEGKIGTLDAKMGMLEGRMGALEGKQEEIGKTVVRAQAVGSAVVLLGGVLAAVLAQAPIVKNVLASLLGAA